MYARKLSRLLPEYDQDEKNLHLGEIAADDFKEFIIFKAINVQKEPLTAPTELPKYSTDEHLQSYSSTINYSSQLKSMHVTV